VGDDRRSRVLSRNGHVERTGATLWAMAVIACVAGACGRPAAGEHPDGPTMTVIAAGTVVDEPDRERWNRLVFLATPRFASGDTDAVSDGIRTNVTSFTFVVLATVRTVDDGDGGARHELIEVGIGYGTPIDGRLTIVAPHARLPGFTPDFLGRQILGAKQKSLDDIVDVGAHSTALAFDAPILMLRDDEHREMTVRHVVRVDPRTGDCATCVWLALNNDDGTVTPASEPLRVVPGGTRESRAIHVDGSRFMFGLPTKHAFAVKELPPGSSVGWTPSLVLAADARTFTGAGLRKLTHAIDDAASRPASVRAARAPDAGRAE